MATDCSVDISESELNDSNQDKTLENKALIPDSTVNSREFVEKTDEILESTSRLIINLLENDRPTGPFRRDDIKSVFPVLNQDGDHVFTFGPLPRDVIISNSVGCGLMTFASSGFPHFRCDVGGAGLLSFTQVRTFRGYTLRDPYKELVKIRLGWIPFCNVALDHVSSTSMTVVELDGTPSGSITFEKLNSVVGGTALSINFIPNLNPKAKYMLFAATIEIVRVYFSASGRKIRFRNFNWLAAGVILLLILIVIAVIMYL